MAHRDQASLPRLRLNQYQSRLKRHYLSALLTLILLGGCGAVAMAYRILDGIRFLGMDGVVLQRGANDCGAAALCMILKHHGISDDSGHLARELGTTEDGTTLLALKSAAERRGLPGAGWRISGRDLPEIPLPAIVYLRKGHFVVLDRVEADGSVLVRDPARGRLRMTYGSFRAAWRGQVLLFAHPGAHSGRRGRWFEAALILRKGKQQ